MYKMYDLESSTHIAKYIPNTEDYYPSLTDSLKGVEIKTIFKLSQMCGYSMYQLTSIDETDDQLYYAMEQKDFNAYWSIKADVFKISNIKGSTESFLYVCLTDTVIKRLQDVVPAKNKAFTYFLQRTIFPDDKSISTRPSKRIEFEAGYQLFKQLSHRMFFTHQVNFLNFYEDMTLELRDVLGTDMPKIGVEIDENDHTDRDPVYEQHRLNVLKHFDNIVFRIPIKLTATQQEIEEEVAKVSKLIVNKANDLLLTYNPDLDKNLLEQQALEASVSIEHIHLYLDDQKTGDKNFPYRHNAVAERLGYTATENYKRFKETIKNNFIEGIDYKIVKLSMFEGFDGEPSNPSTPKLSGKERQKLGGKAKQQDVYIMSRITLNRICIDSAKPMAKPLAKLIAHSFSKLYEIFNKMLIFLRTKVVMDNREHRASEPDMKKRVKVLAVQNMEKTDVVKKSKMYEKCKKELDNKSSKLEESNKRNEGFKKTIKDIMKKLNDEKTKNTEKETEYENIKEKYTKTLERKIKYMNKYRTTKTELDTSKKNGCDLLQKLEMYQTKLAGSPRVDKYKKKVSMYEKKSKEQQDTIMTL